MQAIKIGKEKVSIKLTTTVINQTATEVGVSFGKVQELLAEQNFDVVKWLFYYSYNAANESKTTPANIAEWLEDLKTYTEIWFLLLQELEPISKLLTQLVKKKQQSEGQK